MKILIDGRFYGLENAGLGRYTINLIDQLQKQDKQNKFIILLKKRYYDNLALNENFEKVLCDIAYYSFKEQIEIPKVIKKYNPDLIHFLNSNVPILINGKFVVTIHDLTMYKTNMRATTLPLPVYYGKSFIYKKVLRHAVAKSQRIITPSQFVKDELVKNFKISKEKITVTYEGI